MPRPIRSVDIYLPLNYNDGHPIEESKFVGLQQVLLNRFGGVTSTQRQSPLRGMWRSEGDVYQDQVVVLTVMDFQARTFEAIRYLEQLKRRLKKSFAQLDVLITLQELLAI